jgi:hypothetical protein
MIKLLYKPLSLLISVLSGILAGAIFKKVWHLPPEKKKHPKLRTRSEDGARYFWPPLCKALSSRWSKQPWTVVPLKARVSCLASGPATTTGPARRPPEGLPRDNGSSRRACADRYQCRPTPRRSQCSTEIFVVLTARCAPCRNSSTASPRLVSPTLAG